MAIPEEVQILDTIEVPRYVGSQVNIDVWITYQAGALAPRTVVIPKDQDSPEARRLAIRADIQAATSTEGPQRFKL